MDSITQTSGQNVDVPVTEIKKQSKICKFCRKLVVSLKESRIFLFFSKKSNQKGTCIATRSVAEVEAIGREKKIYQEALEKVLCHIEQMEAKKDEVLKDYNDNFSAFIKAKMEIQELEAALKRNKIHAEAAKTIMQHYQKLNKKAEETEVHTQVKKASDATSSGFWGHNFCGY